MASEDSNVAPARWSKYTGTIRLISGFKAFLDPKISIKVLYHPVITTKQEHRVLKYIKSNKENNSTRGSSETINRKKRNPLKNLEFKAELSEEHVKGTRELLRNNNRIGAIKAENLEVPVLILAPELPP